MSEPSKIVGVLVTREHDRRRLERLVKEEALGGDPRWIDQHFSPLGRRRHVKAVRRRIAEALERGASPVGVGVVSGRRYLMTGEALAHELGLMRAAGTLYRLGRTPEGKRFLASLEQSFESVYGLDASGPSRGDRVQ